MDAVLPLFPILAVAAIWLAGNVAARERAQ
jgi:hypothetical protein